MKEKKEWRNFSSHCKEENQCGRVRVNCVFVLYCLGEGWEARLQGNTLFPYSISFLYEYTWTFLWVHKRTRLGIPWLYSQDPMNICTLLNDVMSCFGNKTGIFWWQHNFIDWVAKGSLVEDLRMTNSNPPLILYIISKLAVDGDHDHWLILINRLPSWISSIFDHYIWS